MSDVTAPAIALWGATGAAGRSVSAALRSQGRAHRVVGRSLQSLRREFGDDALAQPAVWDADDAASIRDAASGINTIVYLVGVPYTQFHLHPELMRKTLAGAIAAGVRRVLLLGTVYPYGIPQTTPVTEDHPRNPHTFKGKMRKEQEDVLLEAHRAGRLQAAILRLPDFYGPGVSSSFMDNIFKAAVHGKSGQLIGPIDTPHEFVFVPDIGPVVTRLIDEPRAFGRMWNFAGPGTITQRGFANRIFAEAGSTPKYMVAGKPMLALMGLFNPFLRELVEMHYLQTTPVIMNDDALRTLLGTVNKTTYDEGIRQTIEFTRNATATAR